MTTDTLEKPKTELDVEFVPVIFANGEDDDTPGLIAALKNEKVLFDENIYLPFERIEIIKRDLVITEKIFCYTEGEEVEIPDGYVGVCQPKDCRFTFIQYCQIYCIGRAAEVDDFWPPKDGTGPGIDHGDVV
jgi:hypothetical protein